MQCSGDLQIFVVMIIFAGANGLLVATLWAELLS
jgi:hypothetical protein